MSDKFNSPIKASSFQHLTEDTTIVLFSFSPVSIKFLLIVKQNYRQSQTHPKLKFFSLNLQQLKKTDGP